MSPLFTMSGWWEQRAESTEILARRLAHFLTALAALDPLFTRWHRDTRRSRSAVSRIISLPAKIEELQLWIEEGSEFESRNGRKTLVGYAMHARIEDPALPYAMFWAGVNVADPPSFLRNHADIAILSPKEAPLSYRHLGRPILLALANAWQTSWAAVRPYDFAPQYGAWNPAPRFSNGSLVYLEPKHTKHVAVTDGVTIEKLPDGAILLNAADPVFDSSNPEHRAAACAMQATLAPLNEDSYAAARP